MSIIIIKCWACCRPYPVGGVRKKHCCRVCNGSGELSLIEEPLTNFMPSSSEEEHEENIGSHIPEENNSPEKDHGKGEK